VRVFFFVEFYFQAVGELLRLFFTFLSFGSGNLRLLSGGLRRSHGFPRFIRGALGRRGRRHEGLGRRFGHDF